MREVLTDDKSIQLEEGTSLLPTTDTHLEGDLGSEDELSLYVFDSTTIVNPFTYYDAI